MALLMTRSVAVHAEISRAHCNPCKRRSLITRSIANHSFAQRFQVVNKRAQSSHKGLFTVYAGIKRPAQPMRLRHSSCAYRFGLTDRNQWRGGRSLSRRPSVTIHSKIAASTSSNPAGRSGRTGGWAVTRIGERARTATTADKPFLDSSKDNTTPTPSTIERAIGADPQKGAPAAQKTVLVGLVARKNSEEIPMGFSLRAR